MRSRLLAFGVLVILCGSLLPVQTVEAADDGLITRGEVITTLIDGREDGRKKVEWYRGHLSKLPLYTDISRTDPMAPYAEAAFALRITSGFSDRTLRPNDPIPAEEAIALLLRSYRIQPESAAGDSAWYAPFIRAALRRNIVADPRSMGVGQPVTRGQFEDMSSRLATVVRDRLDAFPQPVIVQAPPTPGRAVTVGAAPQRVNIEPIVGGPVMVARPTGDPVALDQLRSSQDFAITIPSLGIRDLTVLHPDDPQSKEGLLAPLQNGVGHLFSYPGNGGKIMIYGHSSGYSWDVSRFTKIFRQVNKLRNGDHVFVTYQGNLYEYVVTGQQTISANDSSPFNGAGEELILYTCWPPNSIKQRLIVRAVPVETVAVR